MLENQKLIDAVIAGDLDRVKSILKIMRANYISIGNPQIMRTNHITIGYPLRDSETVLMSAVTHGHLEITKALLEYDPSIVNRQNRDGVTALICAAGQGHLEIVRALLANDAAINHTDHDGEDSLAAAYRNKEFAVINCLLSAHTFKTRDKQTLEIVAEALRRVLKRANKSRDFTVFEKIMSTQFPNGVRGHRLTKGIKQKFKQEFHASSELYELYFSIFNKVYKIENNIKSKKSRATPYLPSDVIGNISGYIGDVAMQAHTAIEKLERPSKKRSLEDAADHPRPKKARLAPH